MNQKYEKVLQSGEYQATKLHYGERRATRSGLLLMTHIEEGIQILVDLDASLDAMKAFCLHPLCQADVDLQRNFRPERYDGDVVCLAMEFRNAANRYLPIHGPKTSIRLSPLKAVNDMLIADKVQQRKDLTEYPIRDADERLRVDHYLSRWLLALGVSQEKYNQQC